MAELLPLKQPITSAGRVGADALDGVERIGRALADPIRRSVLALLLDGTHCPSDLADAIGTSSPNPSAPAAGGGS